MPSSYTCIACKKEFPLEKIRYDGKKVICIGCSNRTSKQDKNKKIEISLSKDVKQKSAPIKVVCMHCNYKFTFKPESRINIMCPYCGGNKLRRDDATAEALVNSLIEEDTE